ncbi:hypothetical protein LSCM1_01589 [Leishmania martiniquensis]|uniref:DUF7759 domain-containing protein n=1 Tax=Leishmania martiniquensis TaxID=1580590 RepID=A0A836GAV8_9TRYP|nr:hypothetical protein LSCM1_01589 [Leishmania martiniquensis]
MAPRRSRVKRLRLTGATPRLEAPPTAAPHAPVAPPVAPPPTATAPAAKPPTSLEPPVATSGQPEVASADPAATAARGPVVEEAPATAAHNYAPASAARSAESAALVQETRATVMLTHVAAAASAVTAGEAVAPATPAPAVPSVKSARAAIRAHRGRLRAKRRAAAALARKAKHLRDTTPAAPRDICSSPLPQPPVSTPALETAPVEAVEAPPAEPTSAVSETAIAQAFTFPDLRKPAAVITEAPSPAVPAAMTTAHRATISRIPKKRRLFAEVDASVAGETAAAPPLTVKAETPQVPSDAAVAPSDAVEYAVRTRPVEKAPSPAPPATATTTVEEVAEKACPVADAPPAPAAARRMATHRISKKYTKGAAAKLTRSGSDLVSAVAIPEATPAVAAAVTESVPSRCAAAFAREKPAVPTAPVSAALPVELPQRVASLTPQSTAPETTVAAAAAPSGRPTMSRATKKKKRFFVEMDEPPTTGATPLIPRTVATPAEACTAVTVNGAEVVATKAAEVPTAPTVNTAPIPPAAAGAVAEVAATKATATRAMARRRSMKRERLPPQAAVAEALASEPTAPTPAAARLEEAPAPLTEAAQATKVAAPGAPSGEVAMTAEPLLQVEVATPPAPQRKQHSSKAQSSKKKARRLTAAAIRRREIAAYNRIPKRFRPPRVPRSVFSRPPAEPEGTPVPTDAPVTTADVDAMEATEVLQPAVVSTTQTESMGDARMTGTETKIPAVLDAVEEAPAVEGTQSPLGAHNASAASAVEPAVVVTETTESVVPFTALAEEPRRMSQARMATKSSKTRMAPSPYKSFFTVSEEVPNADRIEPVATAAATEATTASVEAQPAAPHSHAVMEAAESSPDVRGSGVMVEAESTGVEEEAVARQSALSAESEAAPATAALEAGSTEALQPMADDRPTATEETALEEVDEPHVGKASLSSESAAIQAPASAHSQKKVVRVTNVRDMLKAIRKAKRAGKRGHAKKRLGDESSSQHITSTITSPVDEVVSAEASSLAAKAKEPAETNNADVDASPQQEAQAVASAEETEAFSATEPPPVVRTRGAEAPSVEMGTDMNAEETTATPEVTGARWAAAEDKEATQPPEALPRAEVHVPPAQAEVSGNAKGPLLHTFSSPSPARRQAAKDKIKKHAKRAAERLSMRQTYTLPAAAPVAAAYAPANPTNSPAMKTAHAAAELTVPTAEKEPAAEFVSRAALVLPSGNVVMESFTDDEMVLRRTALDNSWDVGLRFDWQERTLAISSFPTFETADKRAAHPFVQRFKSKPRWLLKEVNETSAAHMKRALDSMNRSLTARFVFRHLR